jgi:hypothetical protein
MTKEAEIMARDIGTRRQEIENMQLEIEIEERRRVLDQPGH